MTYRPDYPPWMFESVVKEAEGRGLLAQPDSLLVDVATGTGKVGYSGVGLVRKGQSGLVVGRAMVVCLLMSPRARWAAQKGVDVIQALNSVVPCV